MKSLPRFLFLLSLLGSAACAPSRAVAPQPSTAPSLAPSTPTSVPASPTPPASPSPSTPTAEPLYLTATVWSADPKAPVLAYHQFQEHGISGATRVRIDDFNQELQSLYDAGYVMVPLSAWLAGDLRVPAGKRPIVFTMDDLFYRNQIRFTADGSADPTTGLGASYAFSQAHPDFGFHWALFVNMGDHPYTDDPSNPNILADAMIWCLEHGALLYNHTLTHAVLSKTSPSGVTWELAANDKALNQALTNAGRPDLLSALGNIFAIPFGRWPRDPDSTSALESYKNPEGVPMQAIMDIDYIYRPRYMDAPYTPQFNRWDIMRMVASVSAVQYFVQHAADVPTAQSCRLGPLDPGKTSDSSYIAGLIDRAVESGACPQGIYATEHFVFRAQSSPAEVIYTVASNP